MGPIERIYRALLEVEIPLDVVAVTGRNEKAHQIKAAARRLGCPRAAYEMVRHCLGLLKSPSASSSGRRWNEEATLARLLQSRLLTISGRCSANPRPGHRGTGELP